MEVLGTEGPYAGVPEEGLGSPDGGKPLGPSIRTT